MKLNNTERDYYTLENMDELPNFLNKEQTQHHGLSRARINIFNK